MAAPWVLLHRVVRTEHAAGAGALLPDFTLPAPPPPGVAVFAAGRGAHPDPNHPDGHPFIIAAAPSCLLASFAGAPAMGENLDNNPRDTRLVVARFFRRAADGQIIASAELVPDRADPVPNISNILSVGFVSNDRGGYTVAELQVRRGAADATLVLFHSAQGAWVEEVVDSPLPAHERGRDWVPDGAVALETTLWWFDLSWGVISCDISGDLDLLFHHLPENRDHPVANQFMLSYRGITVSQGDLRYLEIIREAGAVDDGDIAAGAVVHMWTMGFGAAGWEWRKNYGVSFEEIWNDRSYTDTGLPRRVPVLAAVSPSDINVVYFALGQRIFGVKVPQRRVVHEGPFNVVVNNATLVAQDTSGILLPWHLPPAVQGKPDLPALWPPAMRGLLHEGDQALVVRLRNRVRGTYLYANDDRVGVRLSLHRDSPNAEWELRGIGGAAHVVLRGRAHGLFVAVSTHPGGVRVTQAGYDTPELLGVTWRAVQVVTDVGNAIVLILHHVRGGALSADGRPNGVSVDDVDDQCTMTHWVLEVLDAAPPPPRMETGIWAPVLGVAGGGSRGPFWLPLVDASGALVSYISGSDGIAFRDGRCEIDQDAAARLPSPHRLLQRGYYVLAVIPPCEAARVPLLVPLRLLDAAQAWLRELTARAEEAAHGELDVSCQLLSFFFVSAGLNAMLRCIPSVARSPDHGVATQNPSLLADVH